MPTIPSAKTKSPRGSSGPGVPPEAVVDSEVYQETVEELATGCESPSTPEPPASGSEPEDAVVVDDSVDRKPFVPPTPILSESDRKLATRMTRAIADHLGLSGRTRSVRV